jgi:hypothetical protein
MPELTSRIILAVFWLSSLAMDGIITLLTVFKTVEYLRHKSGQIVSSFHPLMFPQRLLWLYQRLIHVILRDGLLYFAVILTANLSNILTYYASLNNMYVARRLTEISLACAARSPSHRSFVSSRFDPNDAQTQSLSLVSARP